MWQAQMYIDSPQKRKLSVSRLVVDSSIIPSTPLCTIRGTGLCGSFISLLIRYHIFLIPSLSIFAFVIPLTSSIFSSASAHIKRSFTWILHRPLCISHSILHRPFTCLTSSSFYSIYHFLWFGIPLRKAVQMILDKFLQFMIFQRISALYAYILLCHNFTGPKNSSS